MRALQLKVPTGLTNATKIAFAAMTNINQFTSCRIRSPSPRHRAMVLVPKFHQIARRRKAQVLGSAEGVKSVWNRSPQASKILGFVSESSRFSAGADVHVYTEWHQILARPLRSARRRRRKW